MGIDVAFTIQIGSFGNWEIGLGFRQIGGLFQQQNTQIAAAYFLGVVNFFVSQQQDFIHQIQGFIRVVGQNIMFFTHRAFLE